MANTMKALSTVTVGAGGVASINFTNIPATYTDLIVKLSSRDNAANTFGPVRVYFNGADANLSLKAAYAYNSGVGAENLAQNRIGYTSANAAVANAFGSGELYIPNYASGAYVKISSAEGVSENNSATQAVTSFNSGKYNSVVPITAIRLQTDADIWMQYTTATLYGVFNQNVSSVPSTPTIGAATDGGNGTSVLVAFTGVSGAASYTATSTPGSFTGVDTQSPIRVSGLTTGTSYTFKVKANNPIGSSAESAASNSVTPVTPVIPLLGAWTTAATTTPSSAGDGYYGVSLVSGEPRVFNFGGGRSTTSYYNNGQGGTWTTSSAARPVGQGLGSSSKVMTNSGLFYTYGGDTGDQTLVYSTQTGASWTQQASISYSAGWSDGTFFENSGNKYLIAACEYPSGTTAARTVVASNGSLSWSNISSYPVYASAVRFARLTSVAVGMGGFTSTSLSGRRADVYSYNASTGNWTSQTALPFTPGGGYIPAASVVGPADSRIYVGDGTSLWSRGDSSGTWRSETSTPNTWAQGWGTTTSTGAVYLQLSNAGNTFYQQLI